jgi:hypothetical protein
MKIDVDLFNKQVEVHTGDGEVVIGCLLAMRGMKIVIGRPELSLQEIDIDEIVEIRKVGK